MYIYICIFIYLYIDVIYICIYRGVPAREAGLARVREADRALALARCCGGVLDVPEVRVVLGEPTCMWEFTDHTTSMITD